MSHQPEEQFGFSYRPSGQQSKSMLLRQFAQSSDLQMDQHAFLRLLYLETEKNLRLIDTISFVSKGKHKTGDPVYMTALKGLETDVLSMVLMIPELHNGLFYEVQRFNPPKLVSDLNNMEEDEDPYSKPENILELCMALYLKIEASKKAADISFVEGLQGIHFRVRLMNIREMLNSLSFCLKQTTAVVQMTWWYEE